MNLYFQHSDFKMEFVASGFDGRDDQNIGKAIENDVHKRNPNFKIYYMRENLFSNGDVAYDVGDHLCFYFLTHTEFRNGDKFNCICGEAIT